MRGPSSYVYGAYSTKSLTFCPRCHWVWNRVLKDQEEYTCRHCETKFQLRGLDLWVTKDGKASRAEWRPVG